MFISFPSEFSEKKSYTMTELKKIKSEKRKSLLKILDEYFPKERFGELTYKGGTITKLPDEIPIIVMSGRLDFNQKGYDILLNALKKFATDEISIGDYVLTGGELPALVLIDALTRLLPGVLGDPCAPQKDSHAEGLLEHPHYTRPAEFRGWGVPDVLRSGDPARIDRWRREQSLRRTLERRPDLLEGASLSDADLEFLQQHKNE